MALIHERFDVIRDQNQSPGAPPSPVQPTAVNGSSAQPNGESKAAQSPPSPPASSPTKRSSPSEESSELSGATPPKKVRKTVKTSDAALAARLQAEENTRARPTRGGATRKRAPVQKKPSKRKSKSADKIGEEDDSDLEDGSAGEKAKKRNGAFHVCSFASLNVSLCLHC